jgi:hypothetical protein
MNVLVTIADVSYGCYPHHCFTRFHQKIYNENLVSHLFLMGVPGTSDD